MDNKNVDFSLADLFNETPIPYEALEGILNITSNSSHDDILTLEKYFNRFDIPEFSIRNINELDKDNPSTVATEKHPEKQDNILLSEREEEVITSDSIEGKELPQQLPSLQHNGSPQLSSEQYNELQQLPNVQCNESAQQTNIHNDELPQLPTGRCNEQLRQSQSKVPCYGAVKLHDKPGRRHKAVHRTKEENYMLVETCYEAVETDVKQVKKTSNAIEPYVNHLPVSVSKWKASVLPPQKNGGLQNITSQNIYSNNTEKDQLLPSISDQIGDLMIQDSIEQHRQSILQKDLIAEEVSAQELLSQIIQPEISPEGQSQDEEVSSVGDNPEHVSYVVKEGGENSNEMQYQFVTTEGLDQQQSQQQIVFLIEDTNMQLVNEETVPHDGTVDQALTYETLNVDDKNTESLSDNVLTYWIDDNGQIIEPTYNNTNKQLQMTINANQNLIVSETFPQNGLANQQIVYNEVIVESNDSNSYKQTDDRVDSSANNYECHASTETLQKINLHNNIDKEPHSEDLGIDFPELGIGGFFIDNPCVPFGVEEAFNKDVSSEQNSDDLNSQCDDIVEEKAIPHDLAYVSIPATVEQMACQPEDDSSTKGKKKGKTQTKSNGKPVRGIQKPLWEFLLDVLANPDHNPSVIAWLDKKTGLFKIVNGVELAKLWTKARHREGELKYAFFARTLRHYYIKGILKKMPGKKLQYFFCEKHDWRTYDKDTAMKKAKQLC